MAGFECKELLKSCVRAHPAYSGQTAPQKRGDFDIKVYTQRSRRQVFLHTSPDRPALAPTTSYTYVTRFVQRQHMFYEVHPNERGSHIYPAPGGVREGYDLQGGHVSKV